MKFLPTKEDQKALWDGLDDIDCLSIGVLPTLVAKALGKPLTPALGISDALPLLLGATNEGKLSVEYIVERLHDNPVKIFDILEQDASIEVDLDRAVKSLKDTAINTWSPFDSKNLKGAVERVHVKDQTVCLDGELVVTEALGKDHASITPRTRHGSVIASTLESAAAISGTPRANRFSFSDPRAPLTIQRKDSAVVFEDEDTHGAELVSRPPREISPPDAISHYLRYSNPFARKSILSVNQFNRSDFHALFAVAQEMRLAVERVGVLDVLKGKLLTTMFYEPSTRTSSSFNAAMQRLGGRVVAVAESTSSAKKGETLQDTIRTLACYSDAIVLRHPAEESADIAAKYSPVPIINGGNGAREHPTQAFLDLFTIREEVGTVNGITVTFMGDLKYGRPVHSLCKLLRQYSVRLQLVSPKELALPNNLKEELISQGVQIVESEELTPDIIGKSDVLYCTRIQEERFKDKAQFERLKDSYVIDNKVLQHAKQHMCLMHPLPRVNEIAEEVDFDQRASYFRQMRYGLFVRMALLAMVMSDN